MQLLGTTLQCVPALPGAQRYCYSAAAEVGEKHLAKVIVFDHIYRRGEQFSDNVFSSLGGVGAQL